MVATEVAAQREVVRPQNKDEEEEEEEAKVSSQVTALQWVFTKSGLISSHSNRSPTRSTNTHTHEESRQNGRARPLHRFTTVTLPHSMTRCECLRLCMCVSS